ncbi:hypothetical protein GUJ93_ZPchr0001g29663 [Zizania palustris]|uniref:Uncharacterized protein n=1 Tax=Zizania palustris TaxID=103762 RepID=A0A8J5V7G9_ZIZPA|nr:hypothetical protein GUJ93_ZPchr0001g29663 [Zizania palustris]
MPDANPPKRMTMSRASVAQRKAEDFSGYIKKIVWGWRLCDSADWFGFGTLPVEKASSHLPSCAPPPRPSRDACFPSPQPDLAPPGTGHDGTGQISVKRILEKPMQLLVVH